MKKRFIGSLAAFLLGNSMSWAQSYAPAASTQGLLPDSPQAVAPDNLPRQPQPLVSPGADASAGVVPAQALVPPEILPPPNVPRSLIPPAPPGPPPTVPSNDGWLGEIAPREPDRFWINAEYMAWWLTSNRLPPLIGSLPAGLAGQAASSLPPGSISTIFGDSDLKYNDFSGGRISAGFWLDPQQHVGLEGSFFAMSRTRTFGATSPGDPVIGPLFFDVTAGQETIITPADPTSASEAAFATTRERLWATELNVKGRLCSFGDSPFELLAGFRYLDFQNDLSVNTATSFGDSGTRSYSDSFSARNQFYGGQIGAAFDLHQGRWSFDLAGHVVLGDVHQTLVINGSTTDNFTGSAPLTLPGGVLTAPSNIGHFATDRFAVLPEMSFTLGYQVSNCVRITAGYNFLWLSQAIYSGDAVDGVNPANIHGLTVAEPSSVVRPLPIFHESDLWANGLNLGLEVRF